MEALGHGGGIDSVGERTQNNLLIIDDFRGVNNIVDDLKLSPDHTPWSHGGYYNEKAEFERLQGKKLNSSATTGGHILVLQQMAFTDRNVMLIHQSSNWFIEDDLTELMSEPDVTTLTPTEPFIF